MTLGFLDFNTYTFVGGFPIPRGRDLIIPDSLVLSQTMLIKWQIRQLTKGATIDQIPPATLSAALEIQGLGTLQNDVRDIYPSQLGKDVVQLWTIDPSLPHLLTFSGVSDLVTNSVLEFYSSHLSFAMATTNNPSGITDMSAVTTAIAAASAAQIAAANQKVMSVFDEFYTVTVWTNNPSDHIALQPDTTRLGVVVTNTSSQRVYLDLFSQIAGKASTPQYDTYVEPGGNINIGAEEAVLGVMLYCIGRASDVSVTISVESSLIAVIPVPNTLPV